MNREEVLSHVLTFGFGGMSRIELGFLYDVCENMEVLELGSMVGESSYTIASVAKHVCCVDVWSDTQEHLAHDPDQAGIYKYFNLTLPNMFDAFNKNCREFIDSGKIAVYRGNTKEMANNFQDKSFDIIFIDSDHSYEGVSKDFELYHRKIKPTGLIIFHDYGDNSNSWAGVKKLCNEMEQKEKIKLVSIVERAAAFKLL